MRAATLAAVLCALCLCTQAHARGTHTPSPKGAADYMVRFGTTPRNHRANTTSAYRRAAHVSNLKTCNPFAHVSATQPLASC